VPRELLLNAVTLNSAQFNAARAVGPALAGIVLATLGPGGAFFINAVSFAAVLVPLLLIRARPVGRPTSRARPLREFADALRYAARVRGIVATFVVVFALGALAGPLSQLIVVFTDDVFAVGDVAYGLMAAAFGIGAVVVAPFIAGPASRLPRSRLSLIAVFVYGIALVAFALAPSYGLAFPAVLVCGAGWLTLASTLNTTIQVQVDERMRGKVLAAYLMLLTLAMPVGTLVQGWAVEAIGPRTTVALAGTLFLCVGLWLFLVTDLLGHMDDETAQVAPASPPGAPV
jgi:predicted MFS family arabinose efflux permease